ncbi:hypothetical protein QBC34DRAFT_417848 [Podospora aff. communis PSN243]|uniref:INO80 complex subunit B-like conserved region domain-containing protein n=1 Tax=Podospora aff. communis PSN243 TaxID=3040156 RepID=A0AAV9G619_9PEZI|nr:hypothetical protein QBC34DRAFT_417848 [Podospora aff. communis PSN243]
MDSFLPPGPPEDQRYPDERSVELHPSTPFDTTMTWQGQSCLQGSTAATPAVRYNHYHSRAVPCGIIYTNCSYRTRKLRGAPVSSDDDDDDDIALNDLGICDTSQTARATDQTKGDSSTVVYRGDSDPETFIRERIAIRPKKKMSKEERRQQEARQREQEAQAAQANAERKQRRFKLQDKLEGTTESASASTSDPSLKPEENGDITISVKDGAEITISTSGKGVRARRRNTSYYGTGTAKTCRKRGEDSEAEPEHMDKLRRRFNLT